MQSWPVVPATTDALRLVAQGPLRAVHRRPRECPDLGQTVTGSIGTAPGAAGMVTLRHVGLDGTKVLADASKHKAMSYPRMDEAERTKIACSP